MVARAAPTLPFRYDNLVPALSEEASEREREEALIVKSSLGRAARYDDKLEVVWSICGSVAFIAFIRRCGELLDPLSFAAEQ